MTWLSGRNLILLAMIVSCGCTSARTSNTSRTAKEQLLISNSVDQALDKVDFTPLAGQMVFLDDKYLDCVDKNYVVASIRHRVMNAGATIAGKAEDAEIVLEARAGSVGTDTAETFFGMPEIALPGPVPVSLPEIKLLSRTSQTGTAKIGLVAYDAKLRHKLGEGGMTVARSDDNNWYLLGMGPYQNGSVRAEMSRSLSLGTRQPAMPATVAFNTSDSAPGKPESPAKLHLASEQKTDEPPAAPEIQQLNNSLFNVIPGSR